MSRLGFVEGLSRSVGVRRDDAQPSVSGRAMIILQIAKLAIQFDVDVTPTASDAEGDAIANLSDTVGELDVTERRLLALERGGFISAEQADQLHFEYLTAQ